MISAAQTVSFLLVIVFMAYLVAIVRSFVRRKPVPTGDVGRFDWHMFVPCRDEAAVIGDTIARSRRHFPSAHVWVIDDDSEDDTAAIVAQWSRRDSMVHLVARRRPFARTGKGDALNSAYNELNRFLPGYIDRAAVIVCVVDADGELAPDALGHVASAEVFGNADVGAAQLAVHMRNRDDSQPLPTKGRIANRFACLLVRMQDIEFRTVIAAMQALRVRTRSVGLGGNGQFTRLSVLDQIATTAGLPWHGALLEDYELGLHVLLAGYENRYVNDTYVSQEGVTDVRRLLTQRTRWSQGNIQCIKYLPELVRSRHFSSAAIVEAGYYLLLPFVQLLGLIIWPIVSIRTWSQTSAAASDGVIGWLGTTWWFLAATFILGILPFAMWGPIYRKVCEPQIGFWRSVLWGFCMCAYVYHLYISVARAFARVALGRSGWAKTRRNAEDLTIGVVAKEA